jgi:hypothetical protein
VYVRMPALPPQLQRQAELAAKHLRRLDWQRAALGASFASVAVLSVLLYNSYTTNRCGSASGTTAQGLGSGAGLEQWHVWSSGALVRAPGAHDPLFVVRITCSRADTCWVCRSAGGSRR